MKTLLILALMAAILALGCRAELEEMGDPGDSARATQRAINTPTPVPLAERLDRVEEERLAVLPTATREPTATVIPSPTAPPPTALPSVGICYRTPAVQDWILSRLNRTTCAHTSIVELYRITYPVDFAELKAGDLSGLVNVPHLTVGAHQCGDWADPEYAAGVLAGFN